jgi:hypothetical protein
LLFSQKFGEPLSPCFLAQVFQKFPPPSALLIGAQLLVHFLLSQSHLGFRSSSLSLQRFQSADSQQDVLAGGVVGEQLSQSFHRLLLLGDELG